MRDPQILGILQGCLGGVLGRGGGVGAGVVGGGSGGREVSLVREGSARLLGGMRFVGPTGRDQTYTPQGEPTFRKGGGAKGESGEGKGAGVAGAGVGRVRFEEGAVAGWVGGLDAAGKGGVQDPLPLGPVLTQRDQAFNAWKALVEVLGPVVGPQVMGVVEGLLSQKPAFPVLATTTHAEMVACLHELYASEKRLTEKAEEAKGRLEKARAKVFEEEEEEGMAKVDGKLQRS